MLNTLIRRSNAAAASILGAGLAITLCGAANAGYTTQVVNLGDFFLAGGQQSFVAYDAAGNDDLIVGFTVSLDFDNSSDPWAWASDLRIEFVGLGFSIGGFSTPSTAFWDFDGADVPGHYQHLSSQLAFLDDPAMKSSLEGFKVSNDFVFNDFVSWSNVKVTLYKTEIPAPGAFALLGVAGLVTARRRRV